VRRFELLSHRIADRMHCRSGFSRDRSRNRKTIAAFAATEIAPAKASQAQPICEAFCGRDFSPDCITVRNAHRFARRG
jgi:hypothetical protein